MLYGTRSVIHSTFAMEFVLDWDWVRNEVLAGHLFVGFFWGVFLVLRIFFV
jgi:hypothetical protein